MGRDDVRYLTYIRILQRELVPAMGCTEPIAIAYCAAVARSVLGALPDRVIVEASGNIIKNVKSVIVPNTDGHRGIEAAAAIGILAGDPGKKLEVLSQVKDEQKKALPAYLANTAFEVRPAENGLVLDLKVQVFSGASQAAVRIANAHTNIVSIEKDGQPVPLGQLAQGDAPREEADKPDYDLLSVEGIYSFAMGADIADVKDVLDRQIAFNTAISQEGLRGDYGANIGSVLLESYGDEVRNRAKARAAAGSDARMNGCELPVVINSGSGNQGLTASLPDRICPDLARYPGAAIPGSVDLQPVRHPPKKRHWRPVRLLWRGQRRGRRWSGHRLFAGGRLFWGGPYHCKYPGHYLRHCVRRRQGFMRGEDRHRSGCRHFRLRYVPTWPAIL